MYVNHSRGVTNVFHLSGKREPLNGRRVSTRVTGSALVHMGPAQNTFEHLGIGSEQVNLVLEHASSISVPSSTALRNVDEVHHKNMHFSHVAGLWSWELVDAPVFLWNCLRVLDFSSRHVEMMIRDDD